MSAKHRRPFFVFTVVALICGMVLITGVRSKAEDSRAPVVAPDRIAAAGPPITPEPKPLADSPTLSREPGSGSGGEAESSGASESLNSGASGEPQADSGGADSTASFLGLIDLPPVAGLPARGGVEVPGTGPGSRPEDDDRPKGGKSGGAQGKHGKGKHGDDDEDDEFDAVDPDRTDDDGEAGLPDADH